MGSMSIWHWLVIACLIAVLAYAIYKMRQRRGQPGELTEVHGWLALLVAGMTFFGPLVGMGQIGNDLSAAEHQYPTLADLPSWATYKTWAWTIFACSAALSIYGGVGLYRSRARRAVTQAITILWVSGPGAAVVMAALLPALIFGTTSFDGEVVSGILKSIAGAGIWTAYLVVSKRVKARYGTAASVAVTAPSGA